MFRCRSSCSPLANVAKNSFLLSSLPFASIRLQSSRFSKKKVSKVSYDEETNTTTYCSDDAAEVITASFGLQQNIRPSWSWEQMKEAAPSTAVDENERQHEQGDNEGVTPAESATTQQKQILLKREISKFDDDALPQLHKMTEGEIVADPVRRSDDASATSQQLRDQQEQEQLSLTPEEKMRSEILKEQKRQVPPLVSPEENFMLEFQRYYYKKKHQIGPYIGSSPETEEGEGRGGAGGSNKYLALRQRREIERVPQYEAPFLAAETSFRRLPPSVKIPSEYQLRFCYPMKTDLPIKWKDAHLADFAMDSIDEEPAPMKYGVLYPRNYDPNRAHPTMVWLSDHRGEPVDFEDSCAHLFERGPHYENWYEKGWVIYAPVVSVRHAQLHPQEGVVARFCDWVTSNHKVEHGKVHLSGKGYGAFTALRTVMEMKHLAVSCTALVGRLAGPFRPLDRPQEKAHNIDGTHVLMYVPGDMRKTEYIYKFKGFCDLAKCKPPVRCVHFADVRDHQVYYAVNPVEFWNYMEYFRTHNMHQPVVVV